ncbi:MAG: Xaa-Pro peptidase family protein [Candidatus Edwardsbacteria bacterium]
MNNMELKMNNSRIHKLQELLIKRHLQGLLVTNLYNLRYLCGFSGSSGVLLVLANRAQFFTDFRYQEQCKEELPKAVKVSIVKKELLREFIENQSVRRLKNIGFESCDLRYAQYRQFKKLLRKIRLVPLGNFVENLRGKKDKTEIEKIRQAAKIADRTFVTILTFIKPGMNEIDLATEIDYQIRKYGAEKPSFEPIVASGFKGALPHAKPTNKKIKKGELIVLDLGANYQGYCSDMTRTVILGKPTKRQREIYELVLSAQKAGLAAVKDGEKAAEVDRKARLIIEKAGYGRNFGHGLGHGIGLEVHEMPGVSSRSEKILEEGMVVTIEPGVYIPQWGGVRIEDSVVVRKEGAEILTKSPKEMIVL